MIMDNKVFKRMMTRVMDARKQNKWDEVDIYRLELLFSMLRAIARVDDSVTLQEVKEFADRAKIL